MSITEKNIQSEIMLAVSQYGCMVWRNETAGCWAGKVIKKDKGNVTIENARFINAGLCKGSNDIIGITPVLITQEMVGKTLGVFTGIEVKTKIGRLSDEQKIFDANVNRINGVSFTARSAEEAVRKLKELTE
jgi:hypothetical protein